MLEKFCRIVFICFPTYPINVIPSKPQTGLKMSISISAFIAPIAISTIQLGATVDYAILMTTRYKRERLNGKDKKTAARISIRTSIPSILVSGFGLFAATFGVSLYSNVDMIGSICMLLARGALISVVLVPTILPSLLIFADPLIIRTTIGMKKLTKGSKS